MRVRQAAVAGMFYPGEAAQCRLEVEQLLADSPSKGPAPKVLIVPHAGYVYSGPVAARAYNLLAPASDRIRRVVLLGPNHRMPLRGVAAVDHEAFATPLGRVPVAADAVAQIVQLPQVSIDDAVHELEHSLEVHLPFLQTVLHDFELVPLVVGDCPPEQVAEVIDALWGGPETVILVSSDLSHFLSYDQARLRDRETCESILHGEARLRPEQACGCNAINGLLHALRKRQLAPELLAQNNSGDTAGPRDRVVGYAAFAVH